MKLFTKTFGCQMNFADSDEMGRALKDRGFTSTESEESADAILVNTCTVRDLAEHKASSFIGRLKEWKDAHPEGMVIVTGCAAERAKGEFKKRFPHIDLIVGAKDIEQFPKEVDELLARHSRVPFDNSKLLSGLHSKRCESGNPVRKPGPGSPIETFGDDELRLIPPETTPSAVVQYVTIMRGCNYNCSYCIVPAVRGREVYRPVDEILADVAARTAEGAKEIWLLGQTVNSYKGSSPRRKPGPSPFPDVENLDPGFRRDDGYDFSNLLGDVASVPGVGRVRFISPHPYYLTPKLIEAMAKHPQVCEHMHLPVQSGSDAMLKKMKRNYTREIYMRGVNALRAKIPSIAISTDIIVGFPGETDDDYKQTLSLVKEAGFDSAYCFKYSPRPGTASAEWEDDVPEAVKEERVNRLLEITEKQGRDKAAALVGTTQEILIEDDKGDGVFRGKTRGAWRARIKSESPVGAGLERLDERVVQANPERKPGTDRALKLGMLVNAKIIETYSRELHAVLI